MLRTFAIATLLGLSGLTLTAPATAQQINNGRLALEGIAAVVNDKPISYSDVRERARLLLMSLGGQQPTEEQVQQITSQALDQLIDEKLQMEKAAEFELEVADADVARNIERMAAQSNVTREALFEQLRSTGINPSSLEDQSRAEIAWQRVMGGLYGSRVRVSPNQIDDQLNRLKSASTKTQYQTSEIFLFAPEPAIKADAMTAAQSIIDQLNQGASFQVAAQRLSSAPTAATGGDMGWNNIEDFEPNIAAAISQMSGPGISPPIETESGVYILSVRAKREPQEKTTMVTLKRLLSKEPTDAGLLAAIDEATGCDSLDGIAAKNEQISSATLGTVNVDDLGPEGKSLVLATDIGKATDIFAASGGLAVMFVCDRQDNVDNLPTRDQMEDRLYSQQMGMISQRELRDMRRNATIIRR